MDKHTEQGFERYGTYQTRRTGILLVDPYNDFLHHEGKAYGRLKEIAEAVHLLENMSRIVAEARRLGIKVFYVPHHRSEPADYMNWKYPTSVQLSTRDRQVFARDTWGGTFHDDFQPQRGDIVVKEHWSQNGFANTDLDQQLKQHDIDRVILVGLIANTCIEATGRMAMELGYHVTLVTNATAAYSWEHMNAAHLLNGPTFAHAILNTDELLEILMGGKIIVKETR